MTKAFWDGAIAFWQVLKPWIIGKTAFDLGIGFITFTGYLSILDYFKDYIDESIAGLPADVLAVATLGGFMDGFSWVLAAITTRMTLAAFPRIGLLTNPLQ
jgi:hypothetical protein